MHVTAALTSLEPIVPAPFVTVHVCDGLEGCCTTVIAYGVPLGSGLAKVKLVAPAATARSGSPVVASTRPLPASPAIVPPTR